MAPLLRLLALLPLLAVAACGPAATDDDELGAAAYAPDALVLQVSRSGGFLPVGASFRSVPSVSVYGDGRVITPAPEIAVYPGPALPSVQMGRLDPEQLQQLLEAGQTVLGDGQDYGQPPVADAPTTVVVVGAGEQRVRAEALALEEAGPAPGAADGFGLTPEQRDARERLSDYVRQVEEVATAVPAEPYQPERLAVLALPYGEPGPVEGAPPAERAWPGPPLRGGEPEGAGSCLVLTGDELTAVRTAAAEASQETRWVEGGDVWRLAFRPLLPHEQTCEDARSAAASPTP